MGASFLRGAGALSRIELHDEFLELCAVPGSGPLTEEERGL
jgi:hypothetical protein